MRDKLYNKMTSLDKAKVGEEYTMRAWADLRGMLRDLRSLCDAAKRVRDTHFIVAEANCIIRSYNEAAVNMRYALNNGNGNETIQYVKRIKDAAQAHNTDTLREVASKAKAWSNEMLKYYK